MTNRRVLILDDVPESRDKTAALLRERGFDVLTLESGACADDNLRGGWSPVVVLVGGDHVATSLRERSRKIWEIRPGTRILILDQEGRDFEGTPGVEGVLQCPCDIDLLDQGIRQVYARLEQRSQASLRVRDVMVPLESFYRVGLHAPASEAVKVFLGYLQGTMVSGSLYDALHRSVLVEDGGKIVNVLTFTDLLRGLQPAAVGVGGPAAFAPVRMSLQQSNWASLFPIMVEELAHRPVRDILPACPPTIDGDASLMAATNTLLSHGVRRLLVRERGATIGVVREQDLVLQVAHLIQRSLEGSSSKKG